MGAAGQRVARKKNWRQRENTMSDHVHYPINNIVIMAVIITSTFTIYNLKNTGDIVFL